RAGKAGAGIGVGPSVAAVGGPVNVVNVVVREAAAAFVHTGDVDRPIARHVTSNLDIANKGSGVAHIYRGVPRSAVITGEGDPERAAANSEVVPGNDHPPEKGRRRIVV